jgi:DNA-binding transcriptional LysR family regulator
MRDFNDFQFFTSVVQHRGFSAGARALGLPKSRVSRRVALLEERLGVRLLDRTTRGINLTEVGQQVFEHARAVVIEAEAAEEAALRMQSEPRGLVRMSCPFGLQAAVAHGLPEFLMAHPRLKLQCVITNRRVDLISEGIDIAVRVRERLDTDGELQMRRIGVSKRLLVAAPRLLAARGEPTTPQDLVRFPTLHADPEGPSVWSLATEKGDADSVTVGPALATGSLDTLVACACQGAGIALLPAMNCKEALATGALVRVLPAWAAGHGILHLVFVSRRGMLPGVRAVIDFLAGALKSSAVS